MEKNLFAIFLEERIKRDGLRHSDFNVGRATIDRWKSGASLPHLNQVPNLARALKIGEEEIAATLKESKVKTGERHLATRQGKQPQMISKEDLEYLLKIAKQYKKPLSLQTLLELLDAR